MSIARGPTVTSLSQLVYSRERILDGVMVVISLGVYGGVLL